MLKQLDKNKFKHTLKKNNDDKTIIKIKNIEIGGNTPIIIGGPCAIESLQSIIDIAKAVKDNNGHILRGGAFKPRTSPYDFQGLKEDGLKMLKEAGDKYDLVTITEVMNITDIPLICKYVDILQIGARNMQNFDLLTEVGKQNKPVLLKRGMSATLEEWLSSAEYIMNAGNKNVILCERGIRTFETATRNTFDISAVPIIKDVSHLPIFVDPSHALGIRKYVPTLALAGITAGADGVMIEIHKTPDTAISDSLQTINFETFSKLCDDINLISNCLKNRGCYDC